MVSRFDRWQPAQKAKVIDAAVKYTGHDTREPMILKSTKLYLYLSLIIAYGPQMAPGKFGIFKTYCLFQALKKIEDWTVWGK